MINIEWAGWLFTLPLTGWLIKEVWTNISQNRFMKKQAGIEHDYYQKRLLFENKHDFYKEVYQRLRKYQGGLVAFELSLIQRTLTTYQLDAKEHFIEFLIDAGKNESDIEYFEKLYATSEISRVDANYDMTMQKIEDGRNNLNNFLSVNKFMLSEKEDKVIRNFSELGLGMERFIEKSEAILREEHPIQKYQKLVNHFNGTYTEACIELNNLVDDFEEIIRNTLFINDTQ